MRSVSDLDLERYLVDDLEPDDQQRVHAAVAADPALQAHVQSRRAEQRAFFTAHPRLPARAPGRFARLGKWWQGVGGARLAVPSLAVAVGLCVVVVVRAGPGAPAADASTDVHARGTLPVSLSVRRDGVVFHHTPAVPLRRGDAVRVELHSPRAGIATVVGVDARGAVEAYYSAVPVEAGPSVLPGSLVLDDAVGKETWLVIVDRTAHDANQIARAWTAPRGLAAAFPGAAIGVIDFEKEPAP